MEIELWTDGACRGNGTTTDAQSGIGVVLILPNKEPVKYYEKLNFSPNTNNKAEIFAIIQGLNLLYENYKITENEFVKPLLKIYSDSAYTINGITNWINGWRANGWINSKKEPVKNKELWQELDNLVEITKKYFDIDFIKVKGHAGNKWNEECDRLANEAMDCIF